MVHLGNFVDYLCLYSLNFITTFKCIFVELSLKWPLIVGQTKIIPHIKLNKWKFLENNLNIINLHCVHSKFTSINCTVTNHRAQEKNCSLNKNHNRKTTHKKANAVYSCCLLIAVWTTNVVAFICWHDSRRKHTELSFVLCVCVCVQI